MGGEDKEYEEGGESNSWKRKNKSLVITKDEK